MSAQIVAMCLQSLEKRDEGEESIFSHFVPQMKLLSVCPKGMDIKYLVEIVILRYNH